MSSSVRDSPAKWPCFTPTETTTVVLSDKCVCCTRTIIKDAGKNVTCYVPVDLTATPVIIKDEDKTLVSAEYVDIRKGESMYTATYLTSGMTACRNLCLGLNISLEDQS